jgi:hypothetical protein
MTLSMPNSNDTNEGFFVEVSLSPLDLGVYSNVRQIKGLTNDQLVSELVSFGLQLLVSELPVLSPDEPIGRDLERSVAGAGESLRQLGTLLGGAEKILLDAAALREHLDRTLARRP